MRMLQVGAIMVLLLGTTSLFANTVVQKNAMSGLDVAKLKKVASADGLKPQVLDAALNAYTWANQHHKLGDNKNTLTVVDFTLPSYAERMWVLNLKEDKVLMKLYTTQGKGSGLVYATRFSNKVGTDESSLGLFVTSNEYYGHHGNSLRLDGLEKGINNNARRRTVVVHSAWYATPQFIQRYHRAGRSLGCFAVAPAVKDELLNTIKGGSAFFAYAKPEVHDPIVRGGPISLV